MDLAIETGRSSDFAELQFSLRHQTAGSIEANVAIVLNRCLVNVPAE